MQITRIQTDKIQASDVLEEVLDRYLFPLEEEVILVITSKIISVLQGRVVNKETIDKRALIFREADAVLNTHCDEGNITLTIKNGLLIPNAGIDESNANNSYVLYPSNVQETAVYIWQYLRKTCGVSKLGIVITDSHTTIMRRGVTGIALGWCGFYPLYSYIGKRDIWNRRFQTTQINILDALATAAVFVMGEGNEQIPMAVIKQAPYITFLDRIPLKEEEDMISINIEEDLYGPILKHAQWHSNL